MPCPAASRPPRLPALLAAALAGAAVWSHGAGPRRRRRAGRGDGTGGSRLRRRPVRGARRANRRRSRRFRILIRPTLARPGYRFPARHGDLACTLIDGSAANVVSALLPSHRGTDEVDLVADLPEGNFDLIYSLPKSIPQERREALLWSAAEAFFGLTARVETRTVRVLTLERSEGSLPEEVDPRAPLEHEVGEGRPRRRHRPFPRVFDGGGGVDRPQPHPAPHARRDGTDGAVRHRPAVDELRPDRRARGPRT